MFKEYFKKKRQENFYSEITACLLQDSGYRKEYSEEQVKAATDKLGVDDSFYIIGVAVFCSKECAQKLGLDETQIADYKTQHRLRCKSGPIPKMIDNSRFPPF